MRQKKLQQFGICLLIYLAITLFIARLEDERRSNVEFGIMSRQAKLYQEIQRYEEITQEGIPLHLEDLSKLRKEKLDFLLREVDSYNPDAWGDPQKILLLKHKGGYYFATFGNGFSSVLKMWHTWDRGPNKGERLYSEISWPGKIVELAVYGIIAIIITMIFSNRFQGKAKLSEPISQGDPDKDPHRG